MLAAKERRSRSEFEDAFVITCVANVMEVKVLYFQQDLRYEISSYWRFNVYQFHTNLNGI
jgi:hypothetical protein